LTDLPVDPRTNQFYEYYLDPDGRDYQLCAEFEGKGKQCLNSTTNPYSLIEY